ncbi:DUF5926 family protein [Luteipulveratus sp. YIM 133132]|uniref:DUF5926 family protein n=1 Tax=Luteipulveratus flavus TaxID=3031728 RepID=UPI0023B004BE|nr:DUF5926 family protein [Luteipulveratus sp. YIM 133132]MDE9366540.1 DUF5926 family protein [Luteipulveratus sp. YIM 133132]
MGKASRRKGKDPKAPRDPSTLPAPFVGRPFEGLPAETEWVAMREIVPAATATIRYTVDGSSAQATVATVLPMAWPALHRDTGEVLIALQAGGGSGDASRDLAQALLAAADLAEGEPLTTAPRATAGSPRLQDLLDADQPFEADLHEGFDFWVAGADLDAEGQASLERANEAAAPTRRLAGATSAYWCRIGDRTYVRWVLPHDEDKATDALARLHAADHSRLGDGRLLGAFRASGLLVPVWEVDAGTDPAALDEPMTALAAALGEALESSAALTPDERRARNGIVSRQVTLR